MTQHTLFAMVAFDAVAASRLQLVHGDRPPGTVRGWYCSACACLVDNAHDCSSDAGARRPAIVQHLDRLDAELASVDGRPLSRANYWLEVSRLYDPPRHSRALDVQEGEHRYITARWWRTPPRLAGFVLFNPAPLHANKSAATLDRCMGLARGWGFDGCAVANLYSLVLLDPNDCKTAGTYGRFDAVGRRNDDCIAAVASAAALVVVGWGCKPWARRRVQAVLQAPLAGVELHALGLGDRGDPLHPLVMGRYAQPSPWCEPSR